jgi:hypothetical protein
MATERYTAQEYFDLIGSSVQTMIRAGKTERNPEGDEALLAFAFYLRQALGLPQPPRH